MPVEPFMHCVVNQTKHVKILNEVSLGYYVCGESLYGTSRLLTVLGIPGLQTGRVGFVIIQKCHLNA